MSRDEIKKRLIAQLYMLNYSVFHETVGETKNTIQLVARDAAFNFWKFIVRVDDMTVAKFPMTIEIEARQDYTFLLDSEY